MEGLHPAVAAWFRGAFPQPTRAQAEAVPRVLRGESVLVSSPTGSGKTLAGFLAVLSRLHDAHDAGVLGEGVQCVYVSPLKALANDVAQNLLRPLEGIALARGEPSPVRVALRHGETTRSERERMVRNPPHILVTTPESLALLLASPRWADPLREVRFVLVDEVHALVETKRGAHLALALERLSAHARVDPQRVGLSATVRPLRVAADLLTGGRPCALVEAPAAGPCHLRVGVVESQRALYERLEAEVRAGGTTIVFANTRHAAEHVAHELADRLGPAASTDDADDAELVDDEDALALVAPHHGSMSRDERLLVEDRMKRGELRCVVASSSLELGVHVDAADQVVLLGSPKSAARALQRVGRSGHGVGRDARGLLLAADPDELAEGLAVAALAHAREVEPLRVPEGGLDVLAQHLLALAHGRPLDLDEALALTRRAWPYRDVTRETLAAVWRHLRDANLLLESGEAHAGGRIALAKGGGAIPRAGLVRVLHRERYVGEVEEAFAESIEPGDVFRLAGSTWRYLRSAAMTLQVEPARSAAPTVPEWRSEGIAASRLVAERTARILRGETSLEELPHAVYDSPLTLSRVERFVRLQAAFSGLPRADGLSVEVCVDDAGRRAAVFHTLAGHRVNETLVRALAPRVEGARGLAGEAGFALLAPRAWRPRPRALARLFDAPLADSLLPGLERLDAWRRRFRHVAERGLLLRDADLPLSMRQREAERAALRLRALDPEHPLLVEARREALHDALDLDGAEALRIDVAEERRPLAPLPERPCPSPYAACILHPRGSPTTFLRQHELDDAFARCEEWLEKNVPRPGGGR